MDKIIIPEWEYFVYSDEQDPCLFYKRLGHRVCFFDTDTWLWELSKYNPDELDHTKEFSRLTDEKRAELVLLGMWPKDAPYDV